MSDLFASDLRILITDDHLVIQQGLGFIIKESFYKASISFSNSLDDTLILLKNQKFDVLILDINIPGGNDFQMVEKVKEIQPGIKILIFSSYEETTYALRYLKAGANGYLEKSASEVQIIKAITSIYTKGKYLSDQVQEQLLDSLTNSGNMQVDSSVLTNRELEVAKLIAEGESTSTISDRLNLQTSTVSTHKKNIFEKLKISNVAELIDIFRMNRY
jgi:DNA-binding NarL/FixJ family response regulator